MDYSLIEELCGISAVSGSEHTGVSKISDIFKRFFEEVSADDFGNTFGFIRCGKENAPLIMLDAHIDTIGLMVTKINDGGFVNFIPVGGVDTRILPASEVVIHGKKDVYGIIGAVPPHLLSKSDSENALSADTLSIDTGFTESRVNKLVNVGDFIEIKRTFRQLLDGKISCGGLDDRLGIFTILNTSASLKPKNFDICVVASSKEEIGRYGVKSAVERLDPEIAVIVDTTHGDTPDSKASYTNKLGCGGVICKGPCLHRRYTDVLENTAKKYNIPYLTEVEESDPGTNAWNVQFSNLGIPCVMLSLPLRYMHTNVETASLKDAYSAAELLGKFIEKLDGGALNA